MFFIYFNFFFLNSSCGAVAASLNTPEDQINELPGNLPSIIRKIAPSTEEMKEKFAHRPQHVILNEAIKKNALNTTDYILERSSVIKEALDNGQIGIITTKYHIDSGEVRVLDKLGN